MSEPSGGSYTSFGFGISESVVPSRFGSSSSEAKESPGAQHSSIQQFRKRIKEENNKPEKASKRDFVQFQQDVSGPNRLQESSCQVGRRRRTALAQAPGDTEATWW